ncbi:MAG: SDR family NAD(P)-dependent oxidoreductase [Betaproteobacteria bacterium]|nr:SDR family NAD(P)-dependent oxidoreductase [Betaproteobacteria bacterium]
MNQYDMKGRHAVITGGATGLGYAIAERVLASGGSVTLWDRDEAGMAKAVASLNHPGKVHAVKVDVAQHASVVSATEATLKNGPVDAVVNCAGITGPNTQVWNYPVDAWQQVMDVNVNGVFYCCREWTPHLKERPAGRIVNIASVAGKDGKDCSFSTGAVFDLSGGRSTY